MSRGGIEATRWFIELQTVHHVVPNQEEEASEDSESRFQNAPGDVPEQPPRRAHLP
jgi:hypothetical protein